MIFRSITYGSLLERSRVNTRKGLEGAVHLLLDSAVDAVVIAPCSCIQIAEYSRDPGGKGSLQVYIDMDRRGTAVLRVIGICWKARRTWCTLACVRVFPTRPQLKN